MPSRNRLKVYVADSYYHVYNRGLNRRAIFKDNQDYAVFLNLLKRYLSKDPATDKSGRLYDSMHGQIELVAFCLMPNHFHFLIYQKDPTAMTKLLHKVCGSYTKFFNQKYKRSGPLFEDRFKASRVSTDGYLIHISRYIHLNPNGYLKWQYSSLPYYKEDVQADWVKPRRVMEQFEGDNYLVFLSDHDEYKKMLGEIKGQLANDI